MALRIKDNVDLKELENILSEREQDKARIKELEEKNRMLALEGSRVRLDLYIKQNYIPKQKIEDKIEEIKKEENLYARTNIIKILEELLQESEDK